MAHRGPPYRTCDLFDQVRVSYCVDAIFPAQCAVQIISVLQYWYNKLTDQSSLSGSAEVRGRKVGVCSHTVLRSFMSNSVSPWFQSYNNKPPVKKNPAFPVPYFRVRKYAKFGIFYANIDQMTPLRLQRESLWSSKLKNYTAQQNMKRVNYDQSLLDDCHHGFELSRSADHHSYFVYPSQ